MSDKIINTEKNIYRILLLSDVQIIDSSQRRSKDRLTDIEYEEWQPEKLDVNCFDIVRQVVKRTEPDLIICAGDLVYGEFDDSGRMFEKFVAFMDSLNILWAPVFGNHDRESKKGTDWQCERLKASRNCLFEKGDTDGEGNYSVLIKKDGRAVRLFCFTDSFPNGEIGMTEAQLGRLDADIYETKRTEGNCAVSVVTHIQPEIFREALETVGFTGSPVIMKTDGGLQMCLAGMKSPWDKSGEFWSLVKKHGADSVIAAHEHCNSFNATFKGVCMLYGLKSSLYDRNVYICEDGVPVGSYTPRGIPLVGGTVLDMDTRGGEFAGIKNVFYNDYDKLILQRTE